MANWGGSVDDLVASWARPFAIYTSSAAIAVCCFIPATASEALPLAAAIVAGGGVLRTIDKKTSADVSKAQMIAPTPTPTPAAAPTPVPKAGG